MSDDVTPSKTVAQSAIDGFEYRIVKPDDINEDDTVFGGCVMAVADTLAGHVACAHSGLYCRTVLVDSVRFWRPGYKGETLVFKVAVNNAWTASMEIGVKVFAKNLKTACTRHIVSAYYTFVAMDAGGHPTRIPVPHLIPETEDEKRRFKEADERRRKRLAEEKEKKAKQAARAI